MTNYDQGELYPGISDQNSIKPQSEVKIKHDRSEIQE